MTPSNGPGRTCQARTGPAGLRQRSWAGLTEPARPVLWHSGGLATSCPQQEDHDQGSAHSRPTGILRGSVGSPGLPARLAHASVQSEDRQSAEQESVRRLLSAGEVARAFGVSRGWVYDHAVELGAIPLGDGPRPRLRFDLHKVQSALDCRAKRLGILESPPEPKRRRREPRPSGDTVELLRVGTRTTVRGLVSRLPAGGRNRR